MVVSVTTWVFFVLLFVCIAGFALYLIQGAGGRLRRRAPVERPPLFDHRLEQKDRIDLTSDEQKRALEEEREREAG
jgi:hypothetical protein